MYVPIALANQTGSKICTQRSSEHLAQLNWKHSNSKQNANEYENAKLKIL
jgi:hypothetical protein